MVTKEEALTADHFEHLTLKNKDKTPLRARRSGKTKTWKTNQALFSVPVKHGLRLSFYINQDNADLWSVAK